MALTETQMQTLATAIRAETAQVCVDALAIRNDVALFEWVNGGSTQDAWKALANRLDLFEGMDITKFDNLTAGKRDAYMMLIDFAPIDFSRQKNRKALQDIWGNVDSIPILQAMVRKATNGEKYLGGTSATTNTVTAWKLNYAGNISITEVSTSLNRY